MTRAPRKHEMTGPGAFKMRRGVLVFALVALVLIALGLALRAVMPSNDGPAGVVRADSADDTFGSGDAISMGPPAPSVTPAPPVSPVTAAPGVITKDLATATVNGFVASVAAIDPVSDRVSAQLSTVAAGAILAEIENQAQELQANGWVLRGRPVVKSVAIISSDLTATPATALVQACVDSSTVVTLDSSGQTVGATSAIPAVLNLYSMRQDAGVWRVIARTFPNDPAC